MKKDIRFLLALTGVIVLLLSPALLTEKILWPGDLLSRNLPWAIHLPDNHVNNPIISDAVEQSYPYYQFFREELSRGRLALWNPYNLNGTPFHANSVSAVFSPIRWFLIPLPIHLYFEYSALLKLLLSGAGIYFFCRRFGLNSASAALGAFGYLFAGYNLFFLSFPNSFVSALFGSHQPRFIGSSAGLARDLRTFYRPAGTAMGRSHPRGSYSSGDGGRDGCHRLLSSRGWASEVAQHWL